jgi:hypothetical protein
MEKQALRVGQALTAMESQQFMGAIIRQDHVYTIHRAAFAADEWIELQLAEADEPVTWRMPWSMIQRLFRVVT